MKTMTEKEYISTIIGTITGTFILIGVPIITVVLMYEWSAWYGLIIALWLPIIVGACMIPDDIEIKEPGDTPTWGACINQDFDDIFDDVDSQ